MFVVPLSLELSSSPLETISSAFVFPFKIRCCLVRESFMRHYDRSNDRNGSKNRKGSIYSFSEDVLFFLIVFRFGFARENTVVSPPSGPVGHIIAFNDVVSQSRRKHSPTWECWAPRPCPPRNRRSARDRTGTPFAGCT